MENILSCLDNFIRENSLFSVIVVSFVLNIFYDLLKKLFFSGLKYTVTQTNRWSLKNIEFLINHYKVELESLRKISENDNGELLKLIENTYSYILFGLIISIALLFIDRLSNDFVFYSFLGASTSVIIKIIGTLIYNYRHIRKLKNIDFHIEKIKKRIKILKELINEPRRK